MRRHFTGRITEASMIYKKRSHGIRRQGNGKEPAYWVCQDPVNTERVQYFCTGDEKLREVAGSEAGEPASPGEALMTNVPYLNIKREIYI